jgi:hypothetical protein
VINGSGCGSGRPKTYGFYGSLSGSPTLVKTPMHFFHRSCELTGKEVTRRPNRHEKKADQKLLTLPKLKGTLWPSLLKDAQNSYYFPLKQRRMSDKLTFCTATHARADQPLLAAALPHLLTDQPPSCLTCSNHRTSPQGVSFFLFCSLPCFM